MQFLEVTEATLITLSLKTKKPEPQLFQLWQNCFRVLQQICYAFHTAGARGYNYEKWNKKECLLLTHPKHHSQQKLLKLSIVYCFIWKVRITFSDRNPKGQRQHTFLLHLAPFSWCFEKRWEEERKGKNTWLQQNIMNSILSVLQIW